MSDRERYDAFMADMRQLLRRYDAKLSVESDIDRRLNFNTELRVYWHDGTHEELPTNIGGKDAT